MFQCDGTESGLLSPGIAPAISWVPQPPILGEGAQGPGPRSAPYVAAGMAESTLSASKKEILDMSVSLIFLISSRLCSQAALLDLTVVVCLACSLADNLSLSSWLSLYSIAS